MHVRFTARFDWQTPEDHRVFIVGHEGHEGPVRKEMGAAAIAAGAAVKIPTPAKGGAAAEPDAPAVDGAK